MAESFVVRRGTTLSGSGSAILRRFNDRAASTAEH
jgi:hypothetical protein